jgi:hypothetical protein
MNELREICERMLATPPPLRDSGEVLATARRSATRRRHSSVAAASALAAAAAAVVLTLQVTSAGGSAQPAPPVAASAATTGSAPRNLAAPRDLPPARAAATHAERLRQLLLAAVPPGYATEDFPVSYDEGFDPTAVLPNTKYPAPKDGAMSLSFAGLLLSDAGGEGLLSADILATGNPGMLGEGCARATEPPSTNCEVVTVDGVRVEVTTWQDEVGQHISAVRQLDGGALIVSATQGMGSGESDAPLDGAHKTSGTKPALAILPFTTQQLAGLAANPALLQFP